MTLGRLEKWNHEEGKEIVYYKQLLRRTPEKYALLDFLADALYKQAEYEEAIHCWKKLLRKYYVKKTFRILMKIAQAYESLGEIEQAYHYYEQAMKKNQNNLNAIGKHGQMAYMLDLNAFDYISKKEQNNDIAWHNLGLTYYNLGYHEKAIDCLEFSLSIVEESADTWYTLATFYSENYRFDEALYSLERALTLDPTLRNQASKEMSFYSLMDLSLFQYMISK